MWLPALGIFGLVVVMQRRRRRREEANEVAAV
jgi:hypothetical protein